MFRNRISWLAAILVLVVAGGAASQAQAQVYVVGYAPPAPIVVQPAYVAPYYYAAYAPVYVSQPVVYTSPVVVPGVTYVQPVRYRYVRTRTRVFPHHVRVIQRAW